MSEQRLQYMNVSYKKSFNTKSNKKQATNQVSMDEKLLSWFLFCIRFG